MVSRPIKSRTFKNVRQRHSLAKRLPIFEEEGEEILLLGRPWVPQNPYMESLKNVRTNASQHCYTQFPAQIFDIPKSTLTKLRNLCVPEEYKMLRASVYGRDGTNKGYMPRIRQCYRYTYNRDRHPVKCNHLTNIFQKIIDKKFGSYVCEGLDKYGQEIQIEDTHIKSVKYPIKIEKSHFDVLVYNKKNDQPDGFFLPHRDAIKERKNYTQFSVILCLDSCITSMNAGATEIYHNRMRHIFKETTEPGKAIIFPSHALHSSAELKNIGDTKIVLKFDVHIPNIPYFDNSSLNYRCKCENCKENSMYNLLITNHSVFHGRHRVLPYEITNQIGDFRGEFLKCSCPYVRGYITNKDKDILPCECGCWECYGWCKHHPFDLNDQDSYEYGYAYDYDYYEDQGGFCNGDD